MASVRKKREPAREKTMRGKKTARKKKTLNMGWQGATAGRRAKKTQKPARKKNRIAERLSKKTGL